MATNVEELKRRIARIRAAEAPPAPPPRDERIMPNLNAGIAWTLGLPGDAILGPVNVLNDALGLPPVAPILPSQAFQQLFAEARVAPKLGEEGRSIPARAAQMFGGAVIPGLGSFGSGARVAATPQLPQTLTSLQRALLDTYLHPFLTAGGEATAIAGASILGGTVLEVTDNPAYQALAELVGGLGAALSFNVAIKLPGLRAVASGRGIEAIRARQLLPLLTGKSPHTRAVRSLRRGVEDPKEAVARIQADEFGLSPAEASQNRYLLEMQKSAMENDPALADRIRNQQADVVQKVKNRFAETGDPLDFRDFVESRLNEAAAEAQGSLLKLGDDLDPSRAHVAQREASSRVRSALVKAEEDSSNLVNEAWNRTDLNTPIESTNAVEGYIGLLQKRTRTADPDDIPGFVPFWFGRFGDDGEFKLGRLYKGRKGEPTQPSLGELKELRTRLQKEERRALADEDRTKARFVGQLADAVLADMLESGSGEAFDAARNVSRIHINTFHKGNVGKLLGFDREGKARVVSELTLEKGLGKTNEEQRQNLLTLLEAAPGSREDVEEFLKQSFYLQAVNPQTRVVRGPHAEKWLEKNRHLLDEFPKLRQQVEEATEKQLTVDSMRGRLDLVEHSGTQKAKSVLGLYLDRPVGEEIKGLMNSTRIKDRVKDMGKLREFAAEDPTGLAQQGLKAGLVDWMLKKAKSGLTTITEETVPSGNDLLRLIEDERAVLLTVFSREEVANFKRLASKLRSLELAEKAGQLKGGLVGDLPNKLVSIFGRGIAASLGGQIPSKVGLGSAGGSLRTANIASTEMRDFLMRMTRDDAEDLIFAAIEDKRLMTALLTDLSSNLSIQKRQLLPIRNWIIATDRDLERKETDTDRLKARLRRLRRMQEDSR